LCACFLFSFFFQAEDGIRDRNVTGVQTCALPISDSGRFSIEVPKTFMFLRSFPFVSRGLRPTFSSKSIFLVRIIPLSIQLYKDEVLGITSRGNFSFAFAITISGDHLSFSILLSAQ